MKGRLFLILLMCLIFSSKNFGQNSSATDALFPDKLELTISSGIVFLMNDDVIDTSDLHSSHTVDALFIQNNGFTNYYSLNYTQGFFCNFEDAINRKRKLFLIDFSVK